MLCKHETLGRAKEKRDEKAESISENETGALRAKRALKEAHELIALGRAENRRESSQRKTCRESTQLKKWIRKRNVEKSTHKL